jgi:hypothetical protein
LAKFPTATFKSTKVSDKIELHITAEAAEAKGYADHLKARAAAAAAEAAKKD